MDSTTSVIVEPLQLNFKRPSVAGANSNDSFAIINRSNQPVAFKVKTTAPKQYFVKPNHGRVDPGSKCQILVSMHSQRTASGSTDDVHVTGEALKCKDKFLVQLIAIPANDPFFAGAGKGQEAGGEEADISKWWSNLTDAQKAGVQEYKLKCNYVSDTYVPSQPSLSAAQPHDFQYGAGIEASHVFVSSKETPHASSAVVASGADNESGKKDSEEVAFLQDQLSLKEMEIEDLKRALKSCGPSLFSPIVVLLIAIFAFLVGLLF